MKKPQDREAMGPEENLQNRRDDKESDARSASSKSPKQLMAIPAKKKHRYPNWLMADHDLPCLLGKINEFVVILVVKLSASSQHASIYVSNFTSVCEAKNIEIK